MAGKDAAAEDQAQVLKVALAPAAVALEFVQQVRRHLFVAAFEVVSQPDRVPGAAHQRGFHEVVGQDVAAQGRFAGQARQAAVTHEGFDPDDGVVPPELGVPQEPVVQSRRIHGPVGPVGELLGAGDECLASCAGRGRLQDPDVSPALHDAHHAHQGFAGHDRVGVEDDHVGIVAAVAAAEVGHVAAFSFQVDAASAVEDASVGLKFVAEMIPGRFLPHPAVRVGAVAQDVDVETVGRSEVYQGTPHGADAGHDAFGLLVADGKEQGRLDVGADRGVKGAARPCHCEAVVLLEQCPESGHGRPESQGYPDEEHTVDDDDGALQNGPALVRQQPAHDRCGCQGGDEHQKHQQQPAAGGYLAPGFV